MKLIVFCFSLYASKPAILDDIDHLELQEMRPNNDIATDDIVNGDMNYSYLKDLLKLALKFTFDGYTI